MIKILNIQIFILLINFFFLMLMFSMNSYNNKLHPLILMTILLILLIISSMNMSMFMNNHWFSFIMYLIMIGGMMIIFLYFISFINNMKTSFKWIFLKNSPLKIIMMTLTFMMMMNLIYKNNWFFHFNEILSNYKNMMNLNNLNLIFLIPKSFTTILSMMFLLLSMTIIVKICLLKKFTLRKFN